MGRPRTGTHAVPTVDRILQAAEDQFGEIGFGQCRLEDIADVASIRRPSLLYHFSTKHKLYEAVVHRLFQALMENLAEMAAVTDDYDQRVLGLMKTFLEFLEKRPAFAPLVLREIIDGTGPGREILLGVVVPVIDNIEVWLASSAGDRAPEGFDFRGAIMQVSSNALLRASSGPLLTPLWGEQGDHLGLVKQVFFVVEN